MKTSPSSVVTVLLAITANSTAFQPAQPSLGTTRRGTTSLHSSTLSIPEHLYPQLLSSASLCANSESCSLESAESYLREIIHVQAGCVAGTISGKDICNDVGRTSEVVAGLREKIRRGTLKGNDAFWEQRQQEFETLVTASLDDTGRLSPIASLTKSPLKPAYLALAALYTIAVISVLNPPIVDVHMASGGVVPFTAQEVWWAIRDGYVGDLATHLFRNGGLVVGDTDSNINAVASTMSALTPQEVWWSIRDGYVENTLFSSSSYASSENGVLGGIVPFKPQEIYWAVRDGYAGDLVEHWFRNGGLSV